MQTDSHMDFVPEYDAKLMAMWGRTNNEYGVLTTYVHKIEQLNGIEKKKEVPHLCQVSNNGSRYRYCTLTPAICDHGLVCHAPRERQ